MLEIKNVTKILGDRPILRNLFLTMEKGETLAIVGPNGAGKSTLFKCIAGLMKPNNGEIILHGKDICKKKETGKGKIGYLGHKSFLYDGLTSVENLRFYGKLYKVPQLDEKIQVLLKRTGLTLFQDMPIRSFSRGMLQKLAIAKVLLTDPDLLLLDEPHTGLDQNAICLLNSLLAERKKNGASILIISHDLEQVLSLADRAAVLRKGSIEETIELNGKIDLPTMKEWYLKAVANQ